VTAGQAMFGPLGRSSDSGSERAPAKLPFVSGLFEQKRVHRGHFYSLRGFQRIFLRLNRDRLRMAPVPPFTRSNTASERSFGA